MEMSYCFDRGIPHSVFLEKWSPEDRAKVVAFHVEHNSRCQLCGTADWEWQEDPRAYYPVTKVCLGCYYRDSARHDEANDVPGARVTLRARNK